VTEGRIEGGLEGRIREDKGIERETDLDMEDMEVDREEAEVDKEEMEWTWQRSR
jgi:hypothetical protein